MRFEGIFSDEITQLDTFTFEVNGDDSIHFNLLKGAFEHFFLIVKDSEQKIRALLTYKTRLKSYCLSTSALTSDNNTLAGPLPNGTWSLEMVRTYPIAGSYAFEIEFNLGTRVRESQNPMLLSQDICHDVRTGWYRGDFHLHSAYSDGRISLEEICEACEDKKMEFTSMTDHSTVTTSFPKCKHLVMPGTEVTWDDDGHYNIHGLKEFPDYAKFIREGKDKSDALDHMFKYFNEKGCVLSINHPVPRGWELRHNYDIRSFHNLEVINAPHLLNEEVNNDRAIQLFDFLWNNGHYLYAVGGSDAHKKNYFDKYPVGIPTTKVYTEGLSTERVLNSIRNGHAYIQTIEDVEVLYHRPEDEKAIVLPGERVLGEVLLNARCTHRVNWQLILNGEIIKENYSLRFKEIIDVKSGEYYRLQARDEEGNIVLFVNPIHDMHKEPEVFMFQELLAAFKQEEVASV